MEHSGSGYVWQLGDLSAAGLAVVQDGRVADPDEQLIGGVRCSGTSSPRSRHGASGHVSLRELRPWQLKGELSSPSSSNSIYPALCKPGLLLAQREALLSVA